MSSFILVNVGEYFIKFGIVDIHVSINSIMININFKRNFAYLHKFY